MNTSPPRDEHKTGSRRRAVVLTVLCALLTAGFLFFFYLPPAARIGPEQPIPFSHRVHAGVKNINCRFCHPNVARSVHPGIPPVEKCLFCHRYIIARHPQILKEHRYFNTATAIAWRKVNYLPEHVFFNHQRHIKKDIACEQCHGNVKAMDRLAGKKFKMGFCLNCHRQKKANIDCWLACHN